VAGGRCRFCIGDHYYLCDNKILCQFDYEERLVLARLSTSYGSSLAQMKKLQATAAAAAAAAASASGASLTSEASATASSSADSASLSATRH